MLRNSESKGSYDICQGAGWGILLRLIPNMEVEMKETPEMTLKKDLFFTLVYIVEDTIKDDDIDKIINKKIMPAIRRYIKRKLK